MFTARYGLIPYTKQITFRLQKVNVAVVQVNGHRLLGMNHIEVVTILKDLPVNVRMVCARRPGDTAPYRLIDTSQDRAAFAARVGRALSILVHGRYIWYIFNFQI